MYKSFNFLKKLYFVRTGGSKEELTAAHLIQEECEKLGVTTELEEFDVDGYEIEKANLKFLDPDFEVECVGVGMSSSTSDEGITGDFIYITSLEDAKIQDVENSV